MAYNVIGDKFRWFVFYLSWFLLCGTGCGLVTFWVAIVRYVTCLRF